MGQRSFAARSTSRLLSIASLLLLSTASLFAADAATSINEAPKTSAPGEADNSAQNQIHNGTKAVTADQQSNKSSDVEVVRQIRRALTKDSSLSTYAHNIKIIATNGQIILKGPVRSAAEKQTVEALATQLAPGNKITSEIEIAAQ